MDSSIGAEYIASTVASIISVISDTVSNLRQLRTFVIENELNIALLIEQLQNVRSTLHQLRTWAFGSVHFQAQHHELLTSIDAVLSHCRLLVDFIQAQISRLDWNGPGGIAYDGQPLIIFEDQSVNECLQKLERQITAVDLCLAAFRCLSAQDQKRILDRQESQIILAQARHDATSLIPIGSYASFCTRNNPPAVTSFPTPFTKSFQVDDQFLKQRLSQKSLRSMLKRATSPPTPQAGPRISSDSSTDDGRSAAADSARIDALLRKDAKTRYHELKILIVGTKHECVVKQLRQKFGSPYSKHELEIHRQSIVSLVANALVAIMDYVEGSGTEFVTQESQNYSHGVRRFAHGGAPEWKIDSNTTEAFNGIWENYFVQQSFQGMNQDCTTAYFLKSMSRVIQPGYVPTLLDITRAPEKLDQIRETRININSMVADLIEIPKNSSTKIFPHFDGITACLFTMDLASYDHYLDAQGRTNALKSSLDYLQVICESPWFCSSAILLCFINTDLFSRKLASVPLGDHFESYGGEKDFNIARHFILKKCKQANTTDLSMLWHFAEDDAQDSSTLRFMKESLHSLPTISYLRGDMSGRHHSRKRSSTQRRSSSAKGQ